MILPFSFLSSYLNSYFFSFIECCFDERISFFFYIIRENLNILNVVFFFLIPLPLSPFPFSFLSSYLNSYFFSFIKCCFDERITVSSMVFFIPLPLSPFPFSFFFLSFFLPEFLLFQLHRVLF